MADKAMKRCSPSSVIKEVPVKAMATHTSHLLDWLLGRVDGSRCWQLWGPRNLPAVQLVWKMV